MTDTQQIFTIFFAVYWGFISNVQPSWKAFHWPFFRERQARRRLYLSMVILNLLPVIFFVLGLLALANSPTHWTLAGAAQMMVFGVFPAFSAFAFYRLWLGIVELFPATYYPKNTNGDYVTEGIHGKPVPIGRNTGKANIVTALGYLGFSAIFLLIHVVIKR